MPKDIRIKLSGRDYRLLDVSAKSIAATAVNTGVEVIGPIPLPTRIEKFTVLKSPHIDKKSREQFEYRTHYRIVDIINPDAATVDALMKLHLSSGIDVKISVGE